MKCNARAFFLNSAMCVMSGLAASQALADEYGFAGCGFGTKIFGPKNLQTSAATTNNSGAPVGPVLVPISQVWSITAEIAGCEDESKSVAYFEQYDFMFRNFSSIARDAAVGQGESLEGLAASFGCDQAATGAFNAFMKAEYQGIFAQPGIKAVFDETQARISQNVYLAEHCKAIGESSSVELAAKDL